MEEFIRFVLEQITSKPENIQISQNQEADNEIVFSVEVDPSDMGTVIGKKGRTIQSIRNLVNVIAYPKGLRVRIRIEDDENSQSAKPETVMPEEAVAPQVEEIEPTA